MPAGAAPPPPRLSVGLLARSIPLRTWLSVLVVVVASLALPGRTLAQSPLEEQQRRQALVHYRAGQEALHAERFEEALAEFTAAIRLDPLLTLAHYGLGQTHMVLKRYTEAVRAFRGCREAFLEISNLSLRNAAQAEARRIEQIEALRQTIAVLRRDERQNETSIRRLEESVRDLERTRRGGGGEDVVVPAEVSFSLGSAYFRAGALADAEREYLAALKVKPRLGEAHSNLAVVYMLTDRLAEAEAEVAKAEKAGFKVNPALRADIEKRKRAR
jgi:tetratricopeptide (TPR) repeat protein